MTRYRRPLVSALAVLCLVGCALLAWCYFRSSGTLEGKIAAGIRRCPVGKPCRIKVSGFTPFEWDRAYMFYSASKSEREELLGTADPSYQEGVRQFVFLKDSKIVFQESEPSNFEGPSENELIIGDDTERPPPIYSTFSYDAEFVATERESQYGPCYNLRPMSSRLEN